MNLISTLSDQRKGRCAQEASDALARIVKACRETGKKGKLTLALTIKPTSTEMMVIDEITEKIPKPDAAASVFYDDENGNLTRNDPNQEELPLVQMPTQAVNE